MRMIRNTYLKSEIEEAVKHSNCYADIFRKLKINVNGGSYPWLKELLKRFNISTDHFNYQEVKIKRLRESRLLVDYKAPLKDGQRLRNRTLKKHLEQNGVLYMCSCCKLDEWMGKKISLDVDHVNGNCNDNSTENLQFLCPNCHRQKTSLNLNSKKRKCSSCGKDISSKSTKCKSCALKGKNKKTKINWPIVEDLKKMVWQKPLTKVGKILGVTANAVKKRCLKLDIELPKMGYWLTINN